MRGRLSRDHVAVHIIRNGLTVDRENLDRAAEAARHIRSRHRVDRSMYVHAVILEVLRTSHGLDHGVVQKNLLRAVQVVQRNHRRAARVARENRLQPVPLARRSWHHVVGVDPRIPHGLEVDLATQVELEVAVIPDLAQTSPPKSVNEPC